MEYKKGFTIKPHQIKVDGSVRFTDGTLTNLFANQNTCEAYGYKYDISSGTCKAFDVQLQLGKLEKQASSHIVGTKHTLNEGTLDTLITGRRNETLGNNENCFITGEKNQVERDIKNATVLGKMGKAKHTGEIVIGGGEGDGSLAGQNQMSIISLSGETRGSDVSLYIHSGTAKEEEEIYLPNNSIVIFDLKISGICTGGAEGTAGHYKTLVQTGTCLVDNVGSVTYDAGTTTTTASSGGTGTIVIDATTTANIFQIQIGGEPDTNVRWNAVVKLYINQTVEEI